MPELDTPLLSERRRRRYRRAGWTYFLLGIVIMGMTVASPELASPERRMDLYRLLIGIPVFALFAWLIGAGDSLFAAILRAIGVGERGARRIGRGMQQALTMILTLTALGRIFVFTANGLGQRPGLSLDPFQLTFEARTAEPRMLVNAMLMGIIAFALARASWWPLFSRKNS